MLLTCKVAKFNSKWNKIIIIIINIISKKKKGHLSCFSLLFEHSPDIWLETVFHQARDGRQKSEQKLPWEINTTVFILILVHCFFHHYIIGILKICIHMETLKSSRKRYIHRVLQDVFALSPSEKIHNNHVLPIAQVPVTTILGFS